MPLFLQEKALLDREGSSIKKLPRRCSETKDSTTYTIVCASIGLRALNSLGSRYTRAQAAAEGSESFLVLFV